MDDGKTRKLAQVMGDECIAFRVRALNRVITNLYDSALQPFGITVNQATMLIMLSTVGQAGPGRIGQVLIMEKSTVSRNLDRMKKTGLDRVRGRGWREGAGRERNCQGKKSACGISPRLAESAEGCVPAPGRKRRFRRAYTAWRRKEEAPHLKFLSQ